jgi:hypothetical protein
VCTIFQFCDCPVSQLTTDDTTTILLAICLVVLSIWLYVQLANEFLSAPPPPGPKCLLLLGNLMDLPQLQPYVTFAKWVKYTVSIFKFLLSLPEANATCTQAEL